VGQTIVHYKFFTGRICILFTESDLVIWVGGLWKERKAKNNSKKK
jgi:hypothetical protein